MNRQLVVIRAPSNLGLMPPEDGLEPGVGKAPEVLISNGLLEIPGLSYSSTVAAPDYSPEIDPTTGVRNVESLRDYSFHLADEVESAIEDSSFVLVLGGDCAVLLGSLLGARRKGELGLVFIGGHDDFQSPEISRTGGAAGMDLALATGRGPDVLTRFESFEGLVRDSHAIVLGCRHLACASPEAVPEIRKSSIRVMVAEEVESAGPEKSADIAASSICEAGIDRFWIHLDVDVVRTEEMPAVDSPQDGGLSVSFLAAMLHPLVRHPGAIGMNVTIYDPDRDPDGSAGRRLTGFLQHVLA
jgi:arginase